jgi:hypothetical protein
LFLAEEHAQVFDMDADNIKKIFAKPNNDGTLPKPLLDYAAEIRKYVFDEFENKQKKRKRMGDDDSVSQCNSKASCSNDQQCPLGNKKHCT